MCWPFFIKNKKETTDTNQTPTLNEKIIEETLQREEEEQKRTAKLLLIGTGDSGKTTILKQMKLIHGLGFTNEERLSFVKVIRVNIVNSMITILQEMDKLEIPFATAKHAKNEKPCDSSKDYTKRLGDLVDARKLILSLPISTTNSPLSNDIRGAIERLWRDKAVKKGALEIPSIRNMLVEQIGYFFTNARRVLSPSYIPTDQDVLNCRIQTTGVSESEFKVDNLTYKMFDLGGQRSERKKWIHTFGEVTALIFVVPISAYDQKLQEDENVNRIDEAITLFDTISNSRYFISTPILIFFNKIDLFKEKISQIPIKDHFPQYNGGSDFDLATSFFREEFLSKVRNDEQSVYVNFTCATDTEQMKFVMDAVNKIVIQKGLRDNGLM